ncbi:hypothetical protein [Aurantiacibacter spongiae]|nr:hypothetical protein [Aurantiacibacter spongiae]
MANMKTNSEKREWTAPVVLDVKGGMGNVEFDYEPGSDGSVSMGGSATS